MTNAEKYLKDGVNIQELWKNFDDYYYKNKEKESDVAKAFKLFFGEQSKPTLTEDERVILRNIDKKYKVLEKENGELRISTGRPSYNFHLFTEFQHLFQFIKERRRIRDKGVAEMKKLSTIFNELNELEKDLSVYGLWNIQESYYRYYKKNKPKWDKIKDLCGMNYEFMEEEKAKSIIEELLNEAN